MNKEQIVLDALQQQQNMGMIEQLNQLRQSSAEQYYQAIDGLYVQLNANQQQPHHHSGGHAPHGQPHQQSQSQTRKEGKKNYSLELANKKKKAKEDMKNETNRH